MASFVPNDKVVPPKDLEAYTAQGIKYEEGAYVNSRGMKLFTCQWVPAEKEPTALVFLLHGYAVDCGLWMEGTGVRLAKAGFGAFGIDYEGHGQSDGLHGLVVSTDQLADDVAAYFKTIWEKPEHANKTRFLLGESMGGAMSILVSWKQPDTYSGAILSAPMCKISDKLKPPAPVTFIMKQLARFGPTWPILPTDDVIDKANRDEAKREKIRSYPTTYLLKPRLGTALQLLNTSNLIESKLSEVVIPFLVLHGDADTVTDPEISKELHEKSQSPDKTLKIYPEMWHSLTGGELDSNMDSVFADIFSWIGRRI